MKINVKVVTNSKIAAIERNPAGDYLVRVKSSPIENKANSEVINALAEYFDCPKTVIKIIRGSNAKQKVIQISL